MVGRRWSAEGAITLPPEPRSVGKTRAFICDELERLGLDDLAELAALAASELATNAVLHARSEFTVRVTPLPGGTVRISVYDASKVLPVLQTNPPNATVGRGLFLVTQVTDAFGAAHTDSSTIHGPGKEVWFEIGAARHLMERTEHLLTYDPTAVELHATAQLPSDVLVDVQLLNTPLRPLARELARQRELMREMALVAMAGRGRHRVPVALTALAAELENYRGVGAAMDAARDAAIERGDRTMDLFYRLPPAIGPACNHLDQLLDEADAYCRAENLLTLAAPSEGLAVRRWYLGQIVTQINGAAPAAWTGSLD
ncbi:MAG: hypothetical protein QOG53_338 [Frankiales bacterium]|nr:hypothetical protein [Frankiales bacterium]